MINIFFLTSEFDFVNMFVCFFFHFSYTFSVRRLFVQFLKCIFNLLPGSDILCICICLNSFGSWHRSRRSPDCSSCADVFTFSFSFLFCIITSSDITTSDTYQHRMDHAADQLLPRRRRRATTVSANTTSFHTFWWMWCVCVWCLAFFSTSPSLPSVWLLSYILFISRKNWNENIL